MTKISVQLSLLPSGQLALDLPTPQGDLTSIPLHPDHILKTIERALFAQAIAQGTKAAPGCSLSRTFCLREHQQWPSANCTHCRADGRFRYEQSRKGDRQATTRQPSQSAERFPAPSAWHRRGDVQVRTHPAGRTGAQIAATDRQAAKTLQANLTAEDLGL